MSTTPPATDETTTEPATAPDLPGDELERARRDKLRRWREELGVEPYGRRVDGLTAIADARAAYDQAAHEAHEASKAAAKEDPDRAVVDDRAAAVVAGRVMLRRVMGNLIFMTIRDDTGDVQTGLSKREVGADVFKAAKLVDLGDIVVVRGRVGATKTGEITVWGAAGDEPALELACKSLAPPPEKYHGLADAELRYRRRYVDMCATPETIRTFQWRSRLVARIRRFMDERGYLEVETPMMQSIPGGAAARPFSTHHNALDLSLYLRIATELPLKRLLVGGMPRVYEVGRIFRNEGVDRSHNPEFTTIEAYEAFGDCWTMLELTESLLRDLARMVAGDGAPAVLPFGEHEIDWERPFERVVYGELFERVLGFPMTDADRVRAAARELHVEKADVLDHWLLVNEVYEERCEPALDPARPTFVTDYPSAISPLTRPQRDDPALCDRWELLVGGMELGTAYSELNDPDVQLAKFTEQLAGADDEQATFRTLDEDFIQALKVGMPPAGGLGLGVDRIVMLMTARHTIRDVILFPLMRPE